MTGASSPIVRSSAAQLTGKLGASGFKDKLLNQLPDYGQSTNLVWFHGHKGVY
jgi:hypothetical protein